MSNDHNEEGPVLSSGLDLAELRKVETSEYGIGSEVARGDMSRIIRARDRRHGRVVALKELLGDDPEMDQRFQNEASMLARLDHPAIVPLYEAGRWPTGKPFFTMKLVSGRSLDRALTEAGKERVSLLPHLLAVVEGIAHAHGQHVVHRDLRPENILVGSLGDTAVIDWGFALDLAHPETAVSEAKMAAGESMGSPPYMAPELIEGGVANERTDVYALGAILYWFAAGRPPYEGSSPQEILEAVRKGPPPSLGERVPEASERLVSIAEKAMARDPGGRYPTAKEMAQQLRAYVTERLALADRTERRQRALKQKKVLLWIAGLLVLALVGLGGLQAWTLLSGLLQASP